MFGECHAHVIMDGLNYKKAVQRHQNGVDETVIREHFKAYQDKGITFVRDGGDSLGVSSRARYIAPEYQIDYRTPLFAIHKVGHYGGIVGKEFRTMKDYAQRVQEVKKQEGDFIKIMTTGIMDFDADGSITGEELTFAEVKEMVHIAHEEGFAVMSHTNGEKAVFQALEAGVDSIEHGNFIGEECMHQMKEKGSVWVPTVTVVPNIIGCGRFDDQVLTAIWEKEQIAIRQAFDLGVLLALGSDAGAYLVPHGQGLQDELTRFQTIIPDHVQLIPRLEAGEAQIKKKFKIS